LGTNRTSGYVRLESAEWAKADIEQVAVTNPDFMSTPDLRGANRERCVSYVTLRWLSKKCTCVRRRHQARWPTARQNQGPAGQRDRISYRRYDASVFLYAIDLIELNGDDLRPDPLEGRKATLEMILAKAGAGIRFNEHMEGDGETVFRHACKLGLEGIVSKRKDSAYRSGRSR
jgi:ATP dependent DNA ligase domain